MKGIFDMLKKNGVLKFLGRARRPEPVVHDLIYPDLRWGLDDKVCLSNMISHYFFNKTVNSTNPKQPVIKLQQVIK